MKIDSVDFFYLSMPQVLPIADGSQDALLVRIRAGAYEGWGECEASPLTSIASAICPMSHSNCHPVLVSVLGQKLDTVGDILRINNLVRKNSLDVLQADHTLSGIDAALWDLIGKKLQAPVYQLLGYRQAFPKTPYASMLFGDTPQQTLEKAQRVRQSGFLAAKFGWGPFGTGRPEDDAQQLFAAREGLGEDGILLVDAGTIWKDDVEAASLRLPALEDCRATWLEEPFLSGALSAYKTLAQQCKAVKLASGEGCHNAHMAQHMVDSAGIGYIQIDAGRIGGITPAKTVADYASPRGVTFVNHTFTSHLALSASLQPMAGIEDAVICEYPVELKDVAYQLSHEHLEPDINGQIHLPEAPGLGVTPNLEAIQHYLVDVEIKVNGKVLYTTPQVDYL
ncbi:MAG: mandelate racemase/muconate lactonizing enzyme family protein [Anaerolineae bacterium]|nr:mandelate racemase/muconate lactonizing enzyme family protein [Anaerolineae bacterium]